MPTIQGVMHVGLSVTDVRRSADWYRDVLGLDVERERLAKRTFSAMLRHEFGS